MTPTPSQRRALLAAALVATVTAALWPVEERPVAVAEPRAQAQPPVMLAMRSTQDGDGPATDVAASVAGRDAAPPAGPLALDKLQRRAAAGEVPDLFARRAWQPPPPAPEEKAAAAVPPPPPVPTAPPLPFAYLGMLEESPERVVYFLVRGERVIPVVPGEVLDGTWRVEQPADGQLGITYLPLDKRQTLTIGKHP